MKKKITLTLLAAWLLAAVFLPGSTLAGNGLHVLSSSAEMDFPSRMIFSISAESDAEITDIRLRYTVERMEIAKVVSEIYIQFLPGRSVDAEWVWDMRKTGGLPPGSSIDYWWTVTDADGQRTETAPSTVNIEDERYNWNTLTEGNVILKWYEGGEDFAGELMDATQNALALLADNTGAELEDEISIYIYATSQDLRGSMIYPQEWTGGVAFTRYGVIAIGISPTENSMAWGKRAIAHELTHLVVHRVTLNPYNSLPTWLDEGLAMSSEGDLEPVFVVALESIDADEEFITVRSLASPFSVYADESILAYAESYVIVSYLIEEYGREKMFELLSVFHEGGGYDDALLSVYGFDMDGLNALWQEYYRN